MRTDDEHRPMPRARELLAVAALAVVGLLVLIPTPYVSTDPLWSLQWGSELFEQGRPVSYEDGPTPHPLHILLAGLGGSLGRELGYDVVLGLGYLAFGTVTALAYSLATTLAGRLAGLVAALLVGLSPVVVLNGSTGVVDILFLALVLAALVVEIARGRAEPRGSPLVPLLLLLAAGLLRPDAWPLAAAYWLWLLLDEGRARALPWIGLAAAGPLVWALTDLLVTGDPLHSLTLTQAGAEALDRPRGLRDVPGSLFQGLRAIVGIPALILGGVFACVAVAARAAGARVLIAAGLVTAITFLGYGLAEVSLLDRYLLLPAALLAIFTGYGLAGGASWLGGRFRLTPVVATVAAVLLGAILAVDLVRRAPELTDQRALARSNAGLVEDLFTVAEDPRTRAVERCGRLGLALGRVSALTAYAFDRRFDSLSGEAAGTRSFLALDVPVGELNPGFLIGRSGAITDPPALMQTVSASRSWRLVADERCRRAVADG